MHKKSKGLLFTIAGLLCTSLGVFLFAKQLAPWTYLMSYGIGIFLSLYGLIKIVNDNRKNN